MPPWRDLVRAFRILEARGEIRGGRFVEGYYGEQFALPETIQRLRLVRKQELKNSLVVLSAVDPANILGYLRQSPPWAVTSVEKATAIKMPATLRKNRLLFRDGEVVAFLESDIFHCMPGVQNNHGIGKTPNPVIQEFQKNDLRNDSNTISSLSTEIHRDCVHELSQWERILRGKP